MFNNIRVYIEIRKLSNKSDQPCFTLEQYFLLFTYTGELRYDRLNGTRKIGLSYAKSVIYI